MKVVRKVSFYILDEESNTPSEEKFKELQNGMDKWCEQNQDKKILNADMNFSIRTHETQFIYTYKGTEYTGYIVFLTDLEI